MFLSKSILLLLYLISAAQVIAQEKFSLDGIVTGCDTQMLRLQYLNSDNNFVTDTIYCRNGEFAFVGFINQPTYALLKGNTQPGTPKLNEVELFLEPTAMKISLVNNSFRQAHISGSNAQQQFEALKRCKKKLLNKWQPLDDLYTVLTYKYNHTKDSAEESACSNRLDSVKLLLKEFDKPFKICDLNFIETHPNTAVSAFILLGYTGELGIDNLAYMYKKFTKKIKICRYGVLIKEEIKKHSMGILGSEASNFSVSDMNGNTLTLDSLKGRAIILLDFWASWCKPCRESSAHLANLYNKYHFTGLQIIGVDIYNDKVEQWLQAIQKDGTGIWYQVRNVIQTNNDPNNIEYLYNVQTIPLQVLINKQGKIVGRFEGLQDILNLNTKLKEIMNE